MLDNEFVTRLVAELEVVKVDITAKPLTASQLWDKSYEYVIKQAIVDMFAGENNQLYRYTNAIITGTAPRARHSRTSTMTQFPGTNLSNGNQDAVRQEVIR